jgi:ribosome-associated toxin RatA of RatAB toxin-antitoxin module
MNLESQKVIVEKPAQHMFDALCEVKNYEILMPDSIAKFEVISEEAFIFGLKGMPEIKLRMKEKNAINSVVLGAASDKLPFTLTANIETVSENSSEIQLFFEGEFNAMMAMMIKGPISNFLKSLSENMIKL